MRKINMIFIALCFAIILTTLILNSNPVFALHKNGPTPIPGNLFPHTSALHTHHIFKHAAEKLHLLQVVPQT
jgi:hypothetical protein